MNCLIVDDDALSRLDFEHKTSQVSSLKLIRSCSSAIEAADIIMNEKVDLIILDVMLPEMSGLQFVKALDKIHPQIILVSSDKNFALDAFDHDVTDFLVKPVSNERFLKSVGKARKFSEMSNGSPSFDNEYVFVKANSRLVRINIKDILFVEALADYVTLNTSDARYTVHSTMKAMENELPARYFFRGHNSFIIRLDKIFSIEDNCVLINQKLIPISRSKMKGLLQRLKLLG